MTSNGRDPAQRRALRTQWLAENGPCTRCGSPERLHVAWIGKGARPSYLSSIFNYGPQRRQEVLANCVALCHTCWVQVSFKRLDHGKGVQGRKDCKCELCMAARREHSRKQRARVRQMKARIKARFSGG